MSKIAIIAGSGNLPLRVIDKLQETRVSHVVLSIKDHGPSEYESFSIGEIGRMLSFIKDDGASQVVFCGGVKRPSLLSLKMDSVAKKWFRHLGIRAFLGDDALLKGIRRLLEREGLSVLSPHKILSSLLTPKGLLTNFPPSEIDLKDIARGVFVLNTTSKADVGQAVLIQEGLVIGVEAIEGTRALILRCKSLKVNPKGGVLVKMAKMQQDHDLDLPTIGSTTIEESIECGLSGIAIESHNTQIIDFEETINKANNSKVFIIGI